MKFELTKKQKLAIKEMFSSIKGDVIEADLLWEYFDDMKPGCIQPQNFAEALEQYGCNVGESKDGKVYVQHPKHKIPAEDFQELCAMIGE